VTLVFLDGQHVTLQQREWVSALAEQHRAAPSEHQVLKALVDRLDVASGVTTSALSWDNKKALRILNGLLEGGNATDKRHVIYFKKNAGTDLTQRFYQHPTTASSQTSFSTTNTDIWALLPIRNNHDPQAAAKMQSSFLQVFQQDPTWTVHEQSVLAANQTDDDKALTSRENCEDWEASSIITLQHFLYQDRLFLDSSSCTQVPSSPEVDKFGECESSAKKKGKEAKPSHDEIMAEPQQPSSGTEQEQTKKRKIPISADSFSRVAASENSTKTGRGSDAGWTRCPLCGRHSQKLFAQGRGIAAHLHAVHTPWNPGKVERQKRRRFLERQQGEEGIIHNTAEKKNVVDSVQGDKVEAIFLLEGTHRWKMVCNNDTWDPTEQEVDEWNKKVLLIVKELEEAQILLETNDAVNKNTQDQLQYSLKTGVDRNGQILQSYRASLPPLLQAAADGKLSEIRTILDPHKDNPVRLLEVIKQTDRHQSTADHWAAGGGHLHCLEFLTETRKRIEYSVANNGTSSNNKPLKKVRRRDGKTCLHYAARNGHVDCIKYLIQEQGHKVDEISGDGTTPFQLACFGGHYEAMKVLLETFHCSATHANDFGCNAAHWLGMTKQTNAKVARKMGRLLQKHNVNFAERQSQGHTIVHKAAQHKNRHVIEWLAKSSEDGGAGLSDQEKEIAGKVDDGGHTPSYIWKSVGGDEAFGSWMQQEMGW